MLDLKGWIYLICVPSGFLFVTWFADHFIIVSITPEQKKLLLTELGVHSIKNFILTSVPGIGLALMSMSLSIDATINNVKASIFLAGAHIPLHPGFLFMIELIILIAIIHIGSNSSSRRIATILGNLGPNMKLKIRVPSATTQVFGGSMLGFCSFGLYIIFSVLGGRI